MNLKISSSQWQIFNWAVTKITVPTASGEISILSWHQPLSTIIVPWLLRVYLDPSFDGDTSSYITDAWAVVISLSKGLMMTDGAQTTITTSLATTSINESEEVLSQMVKDMEIQLDAIRETGNAEDLEIAIWNIDKINADIRLSKLG